MGSVTTGCEGMGAASASQAGQAPPARKVREWEGASGVTVAEKSE